MLGKDITTLDGLGPYLSLKLIAEWGDDLSSWRSAKHFTSWLGLAPNDKVSGGRMLSSRTRGSGARAAALLRLAAVTVGRTNTALGGFYRRLSSRVGCASSAARVLPPLAERRLRPDDVAHTDFLEAVLSSGAEVASVRP
ncbi:MULTISPECIES: IS110 family transposase [unclassified Bradyrhizobium]|uniref:IS110 family transposase n=1 Tax=unclassified Bradyrhizobium TaxID=2631580 RepID=UPI001FF8C9A7|nr:MULTISPECIES: IS110 family transposase [unclassified Bradyrhizobium]